MSASSIFSSLVSAPAPAAPSGSCAARRLSILTWNVWFEPVEYPARVKEIFRQCSVLRPDIIAFQEVVPEFVQALRGEEWLSEYSASDSDGSTVKPYGVVLLSRLPASMDRHEMPSRMGRALVTADVSPGDGAGSLRVGTVHLESLDSPGWRQKQLAVAAEVLRGSETAVLVGDFNFCSERSWAEGRKLGREGRADDSVLENEVLGRLLPEYIDVWPSLRPGDKGYTFDSTRNPVIRQYEQMRYDRVMAKLGPRWKASSIDLVGADAIPGQPDWLRPSDHFGLLVTLQLQVGGAKGGWNAK